MSDVLVTALVSTFNAEELLPGCLGGLEAQTIADKTEIIVIDSGSEENERVVVAEFQRRFDNIVYLRTERETLYGAWNRGIEIARGRYVTNANTDDRHRADSLECLAAALDAHPDADLAYGNYAWTLHPTSDFADAQRLVLHPPYHPGQVMLFCFAGCHPMWRRSVLDGLGPFDSSFRGPGDYEYLMRFVAAGRRAVRVPEVLSLFHQNPAGLTAITGAEEAQRLYGEHRDRMPIDRLYRVDRRDPKAVAQAWVAQGNLAMTCAFVYGDEFSTDWGHAGFCYERALEQDPGCQAACANLTGVSFFLGKSAATVAKLLARLPAEQRQALGADFRQGRLRLVEADVPAAVEPLEFVSARTRNQTRNHVRLVAPVFGAGDDAIEAVELAFALAQRSKLAVCHASARYSSESVARLPAEDRRALFDMAAVFPAVKDGVMITQGPAAPRLPAGPACRVERMTSWTDEMAAGWAASAHTDEFWVPSRTVADALVNSGVPSDRIVVVPPAVDPDRFDPARHDPIELPGRAGFNFLAMPTWTGWDGWDVLLDAYLGEFSADEDVCLHLWNHAPLAEPASVRAAATRRIRRRAATLGLAREHLPRIEVLVEHWHQPDTAPLYAAVDCLVAPSRGDGWGRRPLEAMAAGLPVIGTAWAGASELITDETSYPIRFELAEIKSRARALRDLRGQRRAEPSVAHLRELMRYVRDHPEEARRKGKKGRASVVARFGREAVGVQTAERLEALRGRPGRAIEPPAELPLLEFALAGPARGPRRGGSRRPTRRRVFPTGSWDWSDLKPRVSPRVRLETAPDGLVAHHVSGRIHDLNHTAALLVELSTGSNSWEHIVDVIQSAFGLSSKPEQPLRDALTRLVAEDVIVADIT